MTSAQANLRKKSLTKPNTLNSVGLHILIWSGTGNVISFSVSWDRQGSQIYEGSPPLWGADRGFNLGAGAVGAGVSEGLPASCPRLRIIAQQNTVKSVNLLLHLLYHQQHLSGIETVPFFRERRKGWWATQEHAQN